MKRIVKLVSLMMCLCLMVFSLTSCKSKSYLSSQDSKETSASQEDNKQSDSEKSQDDIIYVQVAGAVNKPGVYKLSSDDRVYKAIDKAGGLRDDADDSAINQAAKLSDGSKILVKTKAESQAEAKASEESKLVNINTADANLLCTLSGVGQAKAAAIIKYRQDNGGFSSKEDIKKVSGIGDGLYSKIEDLITV